MNQRAAEPAGPAEAALFELARGTAALALAASRSEAALRVLGARCARGGGGGSAADALLEYPPTDLDRLLAVPGNRARSSRAGSGRWEISARSTHCAPGCAARAPRCAPLRHWRSPQLGQLETVPLARKWLKLGRAGARSARQLEILMLGARARSRWAAAPGARARDGAERAAALARSNFRARAAAVGADGSRRRAGRGASWTLLGRIGGEQATQQLEAGWLVRQSAFAAAHALSRCPARARTRRSRARSARASRCP
jgi:hypothetical protein